MAALTSRNGPATSDEALIRSLYEQHGRALLAYAMRMTHDRGAAEDIVQETLIRAWRNPHVLTNGKGSVRGWLFTVERNIITDRHRAGLIRPTEVPESGTTVPLEPDHAESVVDSMTVMNALERLSTDHRDVLVEIYFEGRTVAEAAERLGVPPGTVKSRSHYAMQALRKIFSGIPTELKEASA